MNVDPAALAQIAAQFGIPPAILYALGQQQTGFADSALNGGVKDGQVGVFGIAPDTARSLGYQPGQISGDFALQAQLAAQLLAQQFSQYGNWNQALSAYLTGDPQAGSSPTSSVGGMVNGILGVAGARATYGLGQMGSNVHMDTFLPASESFAKSIMDMAKLGGVVTPDHASQYNNAVDGMLGTGAGFGNAKVSQALQAAAKNNGRDYALGQCTYYVARSLGYIPGDLGNANQWASQASSQGMNVTHKPTVGSAVVYGGGGGYSPQYGHVAVVTAVNPDGSFQVSEMNVEGTGVADTRTSSMNDVIGFIQPPAGTDMRTAAPGIKQAVRSDPRTAQTSPSQGKQSVPAEQGKTKQMEHQDQQELTPAQISQFAERAQHIGLGPGDIQKLMPQVAPLRRLMLESGTQLSDLVPHMGQSQAEILAAIRQMPHPLAPHLTAGAMVDSFNTAALHSIHTVGRMPHAWEAAQFASAGFKSQDMLNHYTNLAAKQPPAAESGKILQLEKSA